MAVSDLDRQRLHERLRAVLGAEEAGTLMALVPAGGWEDVARRSDIDNLERVLRAELRAGIAELRAELKSDIAELRGEIGGLRGEMGSKLLTLFLGMIGLQLSAGALVVAVSRLA